MTICPSRLEGLRRLAVLSALVLPACAGDPGGAQDQAQPEAWFTRAVELESTSETSANASLGDLDGDGDLDIVLAKGRHWPLEDRTYTAALADLDGDGDLDLVVGNDRPDPKLVYMNDGTGRFERAGAFGDASWPTRNVTVTDLTGDDRPDIAVANRGGAARGTANHVCINDGSGSFPTCTILSDESATTIGAGDFNGDGAIDLVVPHRDGGQSYVYLNDGSGGFDDGLAIGPAEVATRAVAVGDVNGDGRPDIVVGDDEVGGALLYLNIDGSSFDGPVSLGAPAEVAYSIAIADLDGDGDEDIVLGNVEAPGTVLLNAGAAEAFTVLRFGDSQGSVYGLAIGDVDGDGQPDIVAGRSGAPNMLYLH
jgi:hypothetical protein